MNANPPLRVAIVNDYEVVVAGLAGMLAPYPDRVQVVEIDANQPVRSDVNIALYDTFAQSQGRDITYTDLVEDPGRQKLVVYSWSADQRRMDGAHRSGVDAFLPKRLAAEELLEALESIHAGTWHDSAETVDDTVWPPGDWPGRQEGLSERESEVISLIVQGLSNEQVADRAFLSINTVKSYIRTSYRKMGVTTRSQAVLWGVDHGFRPDRVRLRSDVDEL